MIVIKKLLSLILVIIILSMSLFACALTESPTKNSVVLTVFAAASLTEPLTELGHIYSEANPDIDIAFNFDSSGTLKTQIEEGAVCDLFISASATPMNNLNCVSDDSRVDLLENKVVLAVLEGNPSQIESFDELVVHLKNDEVFMSIGNADVPVGEYTLQILDYYELSVEKLNNIGCLTYGSNAKEVTTQIYEGMVDCGIVYQTDAHSANLEIVDTATEQMCGQVIYPAAVLETSENKELAKTFLDFLKTDKASAVFEKVGFTHLF